VKNNFYSIKSLSSEIYGTYWTTCLDTFQLSFSSFNFMSLVSSWCKLTYSIIRPYYIIKNGFKKSQRTTGFAWENAVKMVCDKKNIEALQESAVHRVKIIKRFAQLLKSYRITMASLMNLTLPLAPISPPAEQSYTNF